MSEGRVVAVVGPTATGKSDLAVALAQRLDGEIVNADSMQLYAGMDIGTAKLPPAERGGVEHHLLDIWPIGKSAAVAEYQALARLAIAAIHDRGRLPILVGGSGLYLRGALDNLDFPGESREIRERLYTELEAHGPQPLHDRLAGLDPLAAAAILPTNGRRIVRALEVIELTGAPFTARMPGFESIYDLTQIGLDRDDLDERVDLRVHRMMAQGFLDEVRALLPLGLRASPTAGKALGYAQLLAVLDDGGALTGDLDDAIEQTARGTRRFVRRQRSWFRRDPRVRWLDAAGDDLIGQALRTLDGVRFIKGHGTENDFLLLPDLDGAVELSAAAVQAVCDRHAGVGADGVLRVVRSENDPEAKDMAADATFFMDYRNADGSIAEMCGNGIRVFHQYLLSAGLVEPDAAVATRGGIRRVRSCGDGNVAVAMGQPRLLADRPIATAAPHAPLPGTAVEMPNPHVVVHVDSAAELADLDLRRPPVVDPPLPHGQNVEFVLRRGPRHVQLRVHERGVGETRSCGTGICAAVVAVAHSDGTGADGATWRVDVPGGTCEVVWHPDGDVELIGPAVLVGAVDVDDSWLRARG